MNRHFARPVAGLLLAAGGLAACGGDDRAAGSGGSGSRDDAGGLSGSDRAGGDATAGGEVPDDVVVIEGTEAQVSALDNSFRAENIEVRPGTTVVWTNNGRNEHDVLPARGSGWGVEVEDFQPGDVHSRTFDEPGVYHYYCSIHGTADAGMIGTVVVAD
jgi:plastocyanin